MSLPTLQGRVSVKPAPFLDTVVTLVISFQTSSSEFFTWTMVLSSVDDLSAERLSFLGRLLGFFMGTSLEGVLCECGFSFLSASFDALEWEKSIDKLDVQSGDAVWAYPFAAHNRDYLNVETLAGNTYEGSGLNVELGKYGGSAKTDILSHRRF